MAANEDLLKELMAAQPPVRPAKPATTRRPTAAPVYTPPLSRTTVDVARPWIIGAIAIMFLALSWVSTTAQVGEFLRLGGIILHPGVTLAIGLGAAFALTAAEVALSESRWYYAPLVIDVGMTLWWTWPAVYNWCVVIGGGRELALLAGLTLGIVAAYLPERVLFGQRRK